MENNNKELAQMNEQELRKDIQGLVTHNQDLQSNLEKSNDDQKRLREVIYAKSNIVESMKMDLASGVKRIDNLMEQLEDTAHELRESKANPIKAMLVELLTNDIDVASAVRRGVEVEVDNQCMGLKDEILEDLEYKIDEQFENDAFRYAVDKHLRSKF
jgi:signal transduction histidine kinase